MRLYEDIRPYRAVTKTRLYEHEQKHDKRLLYCSTAITYPNEANNISRGADADYGLNDQWMIQPRSTVTLLFFESCVFAMKLSIISNFGCCDNACNRWHGKIQEVYVHNIKIWYSFVSISLYLSVILFRTMMWIDPLLDIRFRYRLNPEFIERM